MPGGGRNDGGNNEQVHGGNVRRVVTQEGPPSLAWRPPSLDHVFGDTRLRDLKPELEQFAVDARRTPKHILCAHLPDQRAELRFDLRSPSQWARLPTPVADPMQARRTESATVLGINPPPA